MAIIGGGNSALDAALNIERTVKSIVIINVTPELTGDPVMIDKITASPHVRVINNSEVLSINGDKFVSSISVQNHKEKTPSNIDVAGVFIEVGSLPATSYLKSLVKLNKASEIIIDKYNMTSREGIFAAGDITDIPEKQIITAAGEGAKAAICAAQYIARSAK